MIIDKDFSSLCAAVVCCVASLSEIAYVCEPLQTSRGVVKIFVLQHVDTHRQIVLTEALVSEDAGIQLCDDLSMSVIGSPMNKEFSRGARASKTRPGFVEAKM